MNKFIFSVTDSCVEEKRDRFLEAWERGRSGQPGRPPRTGRVRPVAVFVDYLESTGIRFATARDSRMNKEVRKWLNARVDAAANAQAASGSSAQSTQPWPNALGGKSHRNRPGPDAVQRLLKQVKALREFSRGK